MGNNSPYRAADFIAILDEICSRKQYFEKYKKFLLRDMSDILDKMNYYYSSPELNHVIGIGEYMGDIEVSNPNYARRYTTDGIKDKETNYNSRNNKQSYKDTPSSIGYQEDGQVVSQYWHKDGGLHRGSDKPALLLRHENGVLGVEEWYENDQCHRKGDKPASIRYYDNGKIKSEEWLINGEYSRGGGKPTKITYDRH